MDITEETLKAIVGDNEQFQATKDKIAGFRAGAGTVLFFEDKGVVRSMQEAAPLYADQFPIWAHQTNAMHQYVIWTALASLDIEPTYSTIIQLSIKESLKNGISLTIGN